MAAVASALWTAAPARAFFDAEGGIPGCTPLLVGGVHFPSAAAFADQATQIGGTLDVEPDQTPALSLAQVVTGSNLSSYATPVCGGPQGFLEFEVRFTDNSIINGPGDDFVVFELTAPNLFSVRVQKPDGTLSAWQQVVGQPTGLVVWTQDNGSETQLNAARLDLSTFGVPAGGSVTLVQIRIECAEQAFAADIAAIGSLSYPVCDDGDPCTIDACVDGVCVHTPVVCPDDGDPCTIDICIEGECVHLPDPNAPDTDGDGVPDCRDGCPGTPPGTPVGPDGCPNGNGGGGGSAGGPYSAPCPGSGQSAVIQLTGSVTTPPGQPQPAVNWTTSCPGAVISNPSILTPTLTIPASAGCPLECSVTLTVTPPSIGPAGAGSSSTSTVTLFRECNGNGVPDNEDIATGASKDCNGNGIPDECDVDPSDPDGNGQVSPDCNGNGIPDECDVAGGGGSKDCNGNGIPDECDVDPSDPDGNGEVSPDCNGNGIPDECDVNPDNPSGSKDCNGNGIPDECDLDPDDPDGNGEVSPDCNGNGIPDECDVSPDNPNGSKDCNGNGVPDECDLDGADPDGNGLVSGDCNRNGIPDECDVDPSDPDGDGKVSSDCNGNGIPDVCDVDLADPDGNGQVSSDCNANSIPDECDIDPKDPDGNGLVSADCNHNGIPDECDIRLDDPDRNGKVSPDCNRNGIPDECEPDSDGDGVIDACEGLPPGTPPPGTTVICQPIGPSVIVSPYFAPSLLFPLPFCGNGCMVGLPAMIAGIVAMKVRRRRARRRRS